MTPELYLPAQTVAVNMSQIIAGYSAQLLNKIFLISTAFMACDLMLIHELQKQENPNRIISIAAWAFFPLSGYMIVLMFGIWTGWYQ